MFSQGGRRTESIAQPGRNGLFCETGRQRGGELQAGHGSGVDRWRGQLIPIDRAESGGEVTGVGIGPHPQPAVRRRPRPCPPPQVPVSGMLQDGGTWVEPG